MGGVIEAFMNPYDAVTNPNGLILLAVAENKLSWDMLKPRTTAALANCPDWVSNYGPMSGQVSARGMWCQTYAPYLI